MRNRPREKSLEREKGLYPLGNRDRLSESVGGRTGEETAGSLWGHHEVSPPAGLSERKMGIRKCLRLKNPEIPFQPSWWSPVIETRIESKTLRWGHSSQEDQRNGARPTSIRYRIRGDLVVKEKLRSRKTVNFCPSKRRLISVRRS
jgi:hypothetical protein